MQKKLTILILMVFNLNFYTQVVIKDEIDLDAEKFEMQQPESVGLSMPFYGRVSGSVYTGNLTNGLLRAVVIEAGGQNRIIQCACNTSCQWIYHGWVINNLPKGTAVTVKVYSHCVGSQMVEAETQLVYTGYNQFLIKAYNPIRLAWYNATTLKFIATNPPVCSYAQACDTGYTVTMPDTFNVNNPFTFTDEDECDPYYDYQQNLVIPMSVFNGIWINPFKSSNILNLNSDDHIAVCFDLQTQKLKFNLLVENTILNYAKDICLSNIQNQPVHAIPIYNLSQICQLSPSECSNLKRSLKAHKEYPFTSGFYDGYYFVEIALTHETEHQKDWEGYIRKYIDNYFNIPKKINYRCEDFSSNQQARDEILRDIKTYFTQDF